MKGNVDRVSSKGGKRDKGKPSSGSDLASRRERRRLEKTLLKKKHRHANQLRKSKPKSSGDDAEVGRSKKNKSKTLTRKRADRGSEDDADSGSSSNSSSSSSNSSSSSSGGGSRLKKKAREDRSEPSHDAFLDFEDMEIARLEKLLGIKKQSKSVSSQKLNKEYSLYEGIGDDFGDFLMKLDNITKKDRIFDEKDYNYDSDEVEEFQNKAHILDDDEQEKSDIEEEMDQSDSGSESETDADGEDDGSENEEVDDDGDEDDEDEDRDVEEGNGDEIGDEDENGEEDGDSDGDDNGMEKDSEDSDDEGREGVSKEFTYKPVAGEDIYGRAKGVDVASSSGKYIPPALRGSNNQLLTVDESSDKNRVLKLQMKGLMNRISDNTKDTIIRELNDLFHANSTTVTSYLFRETLASLCSNKAQIVTFIPLYASIVAALHFVIGLEVGAYIIEYFVVELHKLVEIERGRSEKSTIVSKEACNYLLLLLYLYNYRIIHHGLIVDILNYIVADGDTSLLTPLDVELIAILIDHSGMQIRADDPVSLKASVVNLIKISSSIASSSNTSSSAFSVNSGVDTGRVRFLLDVVTDLKNNKSRRSQNANADVVKGYRKWLGGVKTALSTKTGDLTLRVALRDLLDADQRGRWWRAGGAWAGASSQASSSQGSSRECEPLFKKAAPSKSESEEEKKLMKLAAKLRMTTSTRKNIFVLIMSSRDLNDAYEKIARLDLKGKQDRDVVKVLCECSAQEKVYNEFYAELSCLLCKENRQFKTTFQFTFWDMFKTLSDEETKPRRCINSGRLLARLVLAFHLPLSVIKPIDMSDLSDSMQLFLGSFFMALFTSSVSEEEYQSVLDRVATTKDYSIVREGIMLYLNTHFTSFPENSDSKTLPMAKKRRKLALNTMQAMGVLDFATATGSDSRADRERERDDDDF